MIYPENLMEKNHKKIYITVQCSLELKVIFGV